MTHVWGFYRDGTFAHRISDPQKGAGDGVVEPGWYSISGGRMRLWQLRPAVDRSVTFQLAGESATMGETTMKPVR